MIRYVCGFAFTGGVFAVDDHPRVVVIKKSKPAWMKGRFNGVGGKIETFDPTARYAMVREFQEETGIETDPSQWIKFCVLGCPHNFTIDFFKARLSVEQMLNLHTTTEEPVELIPVSWINAQNSIPNLTWLVPMALSIEHKISENRCPQQYSIAEVYE